MNISMHEGIDHANEETDTEYLAFLYINGNNVDSTSLDECDFAHAEHLFFNEFGHEKKVGNIYKIVIEEMVQL